MFSNKNPHGRSHPWKTTIAVFATLVTLMMSLRVHQDGAPLASFLRFVSRGALFGVIGTIVALTAAALAGVLSRVPDRKALSMQFVGVMAVAGFTLGTTVNTLITWYMASYDPEISQRMHAAEKLTGFIQLRMPHYPPITLRETAGRGYLRRESPEGPLPAFVVDLAESAEDKRFSGRVSSIDLEAIGRAVFRVLDGQREGGSGFPEQLAGLLFDLHPRGVNRDSLKMKVRKFFLGLRIDELYKRDEILHAYLAIAPFNSIAGFELSGIQATAMTFFGCHTPDLTISQATVLLTMLPNPALYFPYQRPKESDTSFNRRIAVLRERFTSVINNASERGKLTAAEANEARAAFLRGLVPYPQVIDNLRRPKLRAIFEELQEFPELRGRSLTAEVRFDQRAERILEGALQSAAEDICKFQAVRRHGCGDLTFDAVVASVEGGIIAETGLTTIAGGASSIIKPPYAAAALESRLLSSIQDFIPGTHIQLGEMLWNSVNEGAEHLAEALGTERAVPFLSQFGFVIPANRISTKNALGGGGWITPRGAARGFVFHFGSSPGRTVPVRLVAGIFDRTTGETRYRATGTQIISKRTGVTIRTALQHTPIEGTAKDALKDLARKAPMAVKTGTSAFYSRALRRVVGEGGSWTLVADSKSQVVISVRARYRSGAPFEPNGGISAALVVRNFLNIYRETNSDLRLEVTSDEKASSPCNYPAGRYSAACSQRNS